jgi:hypothetical protein
MVWDLEEEYVISKIPINFSALFSFRCCWELKQNLTPHSQNIESGICALLFEGQTQYVISDEICNKQNLVLSKKSEIIQSIDVQLFDMKCLI